MYHKQSTTPATPLVDMDKIRELARLAPASGTFADQHTRRSIEIHIIGASANTLTVEIGRPGRENRYTPSLGLIYELQDVVDKLLQLPDCEPEITLLSSSIWITFYNV